ncbi:MAG: hypothetical protein JXR37_05715 [Kiritimatiellae bacterium]|nr:hypothetical protein [Kiritimatiellia bacterium]
MTGKFCEHLGHNINKGMHAQILQNPTFADYMFRSQAAHPDGAYRPELDPERVAVQIRQRVQRLDWPEPERLQEAWRDGLAFWWIREGAREAVRVSPDAGPHGGRAQRVEVKAAGQGVAQWTYLPLHRCRTIEWTIVARSPALDALRIRLFAAAGAEPLAEARIDGVSRAWQTFQGTLDLGDDAVADAMCRLVIATDTPGQFVIARAQLLPADHVNGADPDVVRLLKESRLPLLRWPGGNFVSYYHWEDGVGPVDRRPTRPNLGWGDVEPNLFGTDEFIAFCREVECEPLICINAGDGTPEEAAGWVQYCNGAADTPQGARRAANGYPAPHNVRHWEIGNELYGRWQAGWATPAGYADRYREYVEAMRAVDPTIRFLACGGAPVVAKSPDWNRQLLAANGPAVRCIADHALLGGRHPASTDPLDLYRDFMALPALHEPRYRELEQTMRDAGVAEPRLAITELQLFARVDPAAEHEQARLTQETLVSPATLAEALYDTLYYHMAVRLAPLVELITHSATVNHGGGLRKEREQVFANPCHHAQSLFAAFAGATPVGVEVSCGCEKTPGLIGPVPTGTDLPVLHVLAATDADGALLISMVHTGTAGPVTADIEIAGAITGETADIFRLTAEVPWAANTRAHPNAVQPVREQAEVTQTGLSVTLAPYALVQVRIPAG